MFRLIPFKITPFVLITSFVSVVAVGTIAFVGVPFVLRQFHPRQIEQRKLSTVRDLRGTWVGKATFNVGQTGRCSVPGTFTLVITNQNENTIAGNLTFTYEAGTPTPPAVTCRGGADNQAINGNLVGTRLENINFGTMGTFSGSYTEDTITLRQTATVDNGFGVRNVMSGTANLLRK